MCPIHRIRGFQQLPGPRQIRHWSGRSSPPLCRAPAQSVLWSRSRGGGWCRCAWRRGRRIPARPVATAQGRFLVPSE